MNRRLIIGITFSTLAVVALATAAAAQGPHGKHGLHGLHAERISAAEFPGFESQLDHLHHLLDLTEEQETAIEAILDESRAQGVELRKQQARLQNAIDGEMLADQPSERDLVDLTEEMGALRTELQVLRLKARLDVRAELTDEQRDRMLLVGERRGHRNHRRVRAPRALEDRLHLHRRFFEQETETEDEI